jgi:hypothetical protein
MSKAKVAIPPVRYRRGNKPLLKRLIHPFKAPFTEVLGGPNLDNCTHHNVDCGPLDVEFYMPRAAIGGNQAYPREVNVNRESAFVKSGVKQDRTNHYVCELGVSNWAYREPKLSANKLLPIPREPYVIVTAYWQLERVKNGIQLQVANTEMLEQYLRDDYFAHLESEGGHNWKVRKNEYEEMGPQGRNAPQEVIESFIATQSWSPPQAYKLLNFNGHAWLQYNWTPMVIAPQSLLYTCVLTPDTLFTVRFSLVEMTPNSLKHWWSPVVEDTELLMQGVKIHYKELPSGEAL